MKVGEEYMWVADGLAYPHRVVIQNAKPDSQGRIRVWCYDNDGTSYITWADVKELKQVGIDISQKGDSMSVIKPETNDPVNHPSHYTSGSIECIDAMKAAFGSEELVSFCKLNAFKYIWRCENKGAEIQDLEKASWYLNKAIGLLKEDKNGMEKENLLKFDRCYCDY